MLLQSHAQDLVQSNLPMKVPLPVLLAPLDFHAQLLHLFPKYANQGFIR
jgi:hypothetical protein